MSQISSMIGHLPGMGAVIETFEQAFMWGPWPRYWTGAYIDASTIDAGNSPTTTLRMGLVMGKITATGTWAHYSPSATNGSEVAQGILPLDLRMADVITGVSLARFYAIMVSGGVKGANLIGLDLMARAQLGQRFIFDDNFAGNAFFEFQRFQTKTTNYSIVAGDNFSQFDNLGATGEVDFTLPPIANGYQFGFRGLANQTLKVISNEGGNMVFLNNLVGNSIAYATSGQIVGGGFLIYSNSLATKWLVEDLSAPGTFTVTTT